MCLDTFYLQVVDKSKDSEPRTCGVEWSDRGNGKIRQRDVSQHGNARHSPRVRDEIAIINLLIKRNGPGYRVDGDDLLDLTGVFLRVFRIDRFV